MLELSGLRVSVPTSEGRAMVVDDVSLRLGAAQSLALVGESGCGKSLTAQAILQLLPSDVRVDSGRVELDGTDLGRASEATLCQIRGKRIAMVFQDAGAALDPLMRVGQQITEALGLQKRARRERAESLLRAVGISDPERTVDAYPHQLSGGMQQRIMLATALAGEPDVLIADEPTSALDATTQAQIVDLLHRLKSERNLALLIITHDFGIVGALCERVAVMYAGRIVEQGETQDILQHPSHPYTAGLLAARLSIDGGAAASIPGTVPAVDQWPAGCRFAPRCDRADSMCREIEPALESIDDMPVLPGTPDTGRLVRCHHPISHVRGMTER